MKRFLAAIVAIIMAFSVSDICALAADEIRVYLDGTKISFDVKPQIIDGRTMVPIRAIFEEMGATVTWDANTNTATCRRGNTIVKMIVNSTSMYVNGQSKKMDVSPVIIDGRTLAPARYVAEAFGAEVTWDSANNKVIISSKKVTLYANDGRTIQVLEDEVSAYLAVGWYKTLGETQQTLYAADGRTIKVFKDEVAAYLAVGWYISKQAATAANTVTEPTYTAPTYTEPVYAPTTSTTTTNTNTSYNPGADGNYYRTPTGKKYHLDPNCGGKNSYKTTDLSGLTPCAKCAK